MRGVVMGLMYLSATSCASEPQPVPATPPPAAPSPAAEPLVVFLGDSLTAGYGLPAELAFPALVADELRDRRRPVRFVNAGVSGDTTTGALERLDWVLKQRPDVLVVALGVNDAFRGQPVGRVEANLRAIVRRAKSSGARVLILGMRLPTNYGPDYADAFGALYERVADDEEVDLMPFLLDGVGGHPELNLDDGIHPNEAGQRIVAANVLPFLLRVLGDPR
jgi:acyl-CoA thioesterase-1